MHKREITTLAIKLMAMFLAFQAVNSAQSALNNWYAFPGGSRLSLILPFLLAVGISLGLGLLIWISADSIAKRVFNDDVSKVAVEPSSHTASEVMQIAIGIIGVWLVVTTGPSLINWIAMYLFSIRAGYESVMGGSTSRPEEVFSIQAKATIVTLLIQFVLGLILMLKPSGTVNLIDRLRIRMLRPGSTETGEVQDVENESEE